MITSPEVAAAGQLACLLEVSAPKPGNVSPDRHFHDTRYEDFLASAVAIGPALAQAHTTPLGRTIRRAVEDTQRWTSSNTNLGIVLLLAPLARAALQEQGTLRDRLHRVLAGTTVEDAVEVYAAIRQARPGGLGHSQADDVADRPTV
ncbi:MAG TPA: triphosphoribosyl-dephospho-CoA synthase, partial [Gemmatimonadales bacterium]|nr:triphosphoribosyl-dephospho-CoA synthase [Gemmatimonadales bacterium]